MGRPHGRAVPAHRGYGGAGTGRPRSPVSRGRHVSHDDSRRFTDREVALIIEEAGNLDVDRGPDAARGLSRRDLEEIAREAGISPEVVTEAIARVTAGRSAEGPLALAPPSHRAIRTVDGELDGEAVKRLVGIIDEQAPSPGDVDETLGGIRWSGRAPLRSTRVAITPSEGETTIQVSEEMSGTTARIAHYAPGAAGLLLSSAVVAGLDASAAVSVIGLLAGLGTGLGVGRLIWNRLSRASAERVRRLAATLTREAGEPG